MKGGLCRVCDADCEIKDVGELDIDQKAEWKRKR